MREAPRTPPLEDYAPVGQPLINVSTRSEAVAVERVTPRRLEDAFAEAAKASPASPIVVDSPLGALGAEIAALNSAIALDEESD